MQFISSSEPIKFTRQRSPVSYLTSWSLRAVYASIVAVAPDRGLDLCGTSSPSIRRSELIWSRPELKKSSSARRRDGICSLTVRRRVLGGALDRDRVTLCVNHPIVLCVHAHRPAGRHRPRHRRSETVSYHSSTYLAAPAASSICFCHSRRRSNSQALPLSLSTLPIFA